MLNADEIATVVRGRTERMLDKTWNDILVKEMNKEKLNWWRVCLKKPLPSEALRTSEQHGWPRRGEGNG